MQLEVAALKFMDTISFVALGMRLSKSFQARCCEQQKLFLPHGKFSNSSNFMKPDLIKHEGFNSSLNNENERMVKGDCYNELTLTKIN